MNFIRGIYTSADTPDRTRVFTAANGDATIREFRVNPALPNMEVVQNLTRHPGEALLHVANIIPANGTFAFRFTLEGSNTVQKMVVFLLHYSVFTGPDRSYLNLNFVSNPYKPLKQ